jgi:3-hydroxyisobutyrate dehydrogenase
MTVSERGAPPPEPGPAPCAGLGIAREGAAGRIRLDRPQALNALTAPMCWAIEGALAAWADDPAVALVLIEGSGDRAFCAGGDLRALHAAGTSGDTEAARAFWRDEYRMNARIAEYPKPVVSFLHGLVLGGGVGLGCHASHRVLGETARVGLPEASIGLVPDVGSTLLLARAPGRLGEYLGTTCRQMAPGDALLAGFADSFVPEARWPELKAALCRSGDPGEIARFAEKEPRPAPTLLAHAAEMEDAFAGERLADIVTRLRHTGGSFAGECLDTMARHSPLAMACAVELVHRMRPKAHRPGAIRAALELEYRYAHRAIAGGDLLEGIRAALISRDEAARWTHTLDAVPAVSVSGMLLPLGAETLRFDAPLPDATG